MDFTNRDLGVFSYKKMPTVYNIYCVYNIYREKETFVDREWSRKAPKVENFAYKIIRASYLRNSLEIHFYRAC